jgi:hypothetical protein
VLAVKLEQVMPPAAPVSASWVCKHLVPCLCQQATLDWHQHQQLQQGVDGMAVMPAASALVELLSSEGLLLPASGEVLVSARALAKALDSLPVDLQQHLTQHWQQLLLSRQQAPVDADHAAAAAAAAGCTSGAARQELAAQLLPWATLQPMLCLLNHLKDLSASPVAAFLAAALASCVAAAHAANVSSKSALQPGDRAGAVSSVKHVVRHLLLPLRFKLQVPVRVWLLQQLVPAGSGCEGGVTEGSAAAGHMSEWLSAAAKTCLWLEVLGVLKQDCAVHLAQGLQLLAAEVGAGASSQHSAAAPAASLQAAKARDLAETLVKLQQQLHMLEVEGQAHEADSAAGGQSCTGSLAQRLKEALTAGDAAACQKLGRLL